MNGGLDDPAENPPATLRIEFAIPQERVGTFERMAKDMERDATEAGEAVAVDIVALPPVTGEARRVVALDFRTRDELDRWRASREAAVWRAGLENVATEKPKLQVRNGVEIWFSSSATRYADPPAGYKMALLSVIGLYPTLLLLNGLLAPLHRLAPEWLNALLTTCILSALVTWPIMPVLTTVFRDWLYPEPP